MTGRVGLGLHAENVFLGLARSRLACGMLVRLVIATIVMKDMFKRRRFWRYGVGAGGRGISRSLQVIGNGLFFVQTEDAGVSPNESFIKNAARQLVELILFERPQHPSPDFSGDGDLLQRDIALLTLKFQFFAKGRQTKSPASRGRRWIKFYPAEKQEHRKLLTATTFRHGRLFK